MKIIPEPKKDFDFAILGLGYESRSTYSHLQNKFNCDTVALGYDQQTEENVYKKNKKYFRDEGVKVIEGGHQDISNYIENLTEKFKAPTNIILDISVMSRQRLSSIMIKLIRNLPKDSSLTISYSISSYIPAPTESSPIKEIGPVSSELSGVIGGLEKPVSIIIGLGYEKNKALGIYNYFDTKSNLVFTLIPKSQEHQFESDVKKNNNILLSNIPQKNQHYYDTANPYNTYLDLKALYQTLKEISRPILIPLGPKILTAINVVIGLQFSPNIPVWRVSSNHTEKPIDRAARGEEIKFTIQL